MKFDRKSIRVMSIAELYYYCARALLAQGTGPRYSQMLENRIVALSKEITKRSN